MRRIAANLVSVNTPTVAVDGQIVPVPFFFLRLFLVCCCGCCWDGDTIDGARGEKKTQSRNGNE